MGAGGAKPPGKPPCPPFLLLPEEDKAQVRHGRVQSHRQHKQKAALNGRLGEWTGHLGTGRRPCRQAQCSQEALCLVHLHVATETALGPWGALRAQHTAVRPHVQGEGSPGKLLHFCSEDTFHAGSPGVPPSPAQPPCKPALTHSDGSARGQAAPWPLHPCHLAPDKGRTCAGGPRSPRPPGDPVRVSSGGSHSTFRKWGCSRCSTRHC